MTALKDMIGSYVKEDELEKEDEIQNPEDVPVIGEVVSVGEPSDLEPQEQSEEPITAQPETEKEEQKAAPYSDGVYVVEKGDTLAIISRKVYGDLDHIDAICRMNGLKNGNLILVGQKLLLP